MADSVNENNFFGLTLSPLNYRRIEAFKRNKRGYWSARIFLILFFTSLFANFIANDRPLIVSFEDNILFPVFVDYPETKFGGFFETTTQYRDPYVQDLITSAGGWIIWPPIRFSYDTINYSLDVPVPSAPSSTNWIGTDDQGEMLQQEQYMGSVFQFFSDLFL